MYRVTLELSDKEFLLFLTSNPKGWMKIENTAVDHNYSIPASDAPKFTANDELPEYRPVRQRAKRRTKAEMEAARLADRVDAL